MKKVYRIVACPFIHHSFLQMVLHMYFATPLFIEKEKKMGTLCFLFDFCVKNFLIQFLFLFMMLACGLATPDFFLVQKSSGLMNYFILNLTMKVLENPDDICSLMCLPWKIKSKFCLLFLMLTINVVFSVKFDIFAALFLAFTEFYCYRNAFVLSRDRILDLETNEWLSYLMNFHNFISYLESQANLHVIDTIISLNQENEHQTSFENGYEMSTVAKNNDQNNNDFQESKEVLLEDKDFNENILEKNHKLSHK